MFSLQALRDEIVNDPNAIGYKVDATTWKGDRVIVELVNDLANGATVRRRRVLPSEITASLDLGEYQGLTVASRQYLDLLFQNSDESVGAGIDTTEPAIFAALTTLFGPASQTRAALLTKIDRPGSRAEVLWGDGTVVTALQVARAANL